MVKVLGVNGSGAPIQSSGAASSARQVMPDMQQAPSAGPSVRPATPQPPNGGPVPISRDHLQSLHEQSRTQREQEAQEKVAQLEAERIKREEALKTEGLKGKEAETSYTGDGSEGMGGAVLGGFAQGFGGTVTNIKNAEAVDKKFPGRQREEIISHDPGLLERNAAYQRGELDLQI